MDQQEFGRYRLQRLIGSGGMGDVYEALDTERDRVVALKLLPHLFGGNDEFEQRFRRESRVAARLRDPHIIPIHDYGEIDQRLYIDMRLVDDGDTIGSLLREHGRLAPARAVGLIGQVAEALDAAHSDGLVHRDIKPSNVLVTARDFVYVVDFGIAHAVGHTASGLTMSGSTVGTLDYMAPERFGNKMLDRRADVYSLACLLYQCLTARTPFDGTDLPALMYAHLHIDPPAPSAVDPDIPSGLDTVVATGMAKELDDRYATAGELAQAARQALGGSVAAPAPKPADPPPDETPTRRRTRPDLASEQAPAEPQTVVTPTVSRVAGPQAVPPPPASPPTSPPPPSPPTSSPPPPPPEPDPDPEPTGDDRTWSTRRPGRGVLVGVAVAAVLVIGLIVAVTTVSWSSSKPPEARVGTAAVAPAAAPSAPESLGRPTVAGIVPTPPTPGFVAVAPGGRSAYVSNRDPRAVTVIDLATHRTVATVPAPSPPRFVAFTADGSRAFVSCYNDDDTGNAVEVIDTRTNTAAATIPLDRRPYDPTVSPDQRTLWVPSHDTGSIDLVDLATNAVTRRIPVAPNPHWVAFARGNVYVSSHESNLVTVMREDGSVITTIPMGRSPHAEATSPDGSRVAVVEFGSDTVTLIDTATNQKVATVPVGRSPQHVAWTADGRHLYTANVDDGTVSVVDTATDTVAASIQVGGSPTSLAMIDPPGTTAAVSNLDAAHLTLLTVAR